MIAILDRDEFGNRYQNSNILNHTKFGRIFRTTGLTNRDCYSSRSQDDSIFLIRGSAKCEELHGTAVQFKCIRCESA